ncbi:MAG: hypothetical protein IT340_20110 [Chloroflexi bacterium]|nr:hypothetical protein [Chloroflexota bacterium]
MAMPRIAVAGKMRTGKTTLARLLAGTYWVPLDSFAAPLKQAGKVLGYTTDGEQKDRAFLQDFAIAATAADSWRFTRLMEQRHPDVIHGHAGLIIDDLRRPEEMLWCLAHGFITIRLEVPWWVQTRRGAEKSRLSHATETALDEVPASFWDALLADEWSANVVPSRVEVAVIRRGFSQPPALISAPPLETGGYGVTTPEMVALSLPDGRRLPPLTAREQDA